ncbi:MAG: FixH family protein [Leptospiraceae bacterium]|nr:FixH family protein [Leptospiraceae bacterium]MDW7976997.1 FixH family protein [Leptospiraceae bacterium]
MKQPLHPSVKRIFYLVFFIFIIFFSAIGITIYIAQKNYEPIIDARYYEKGLNYVDRNKEFQKAKEKKWEANVNIWDKNVIKREFPLIIEIKNQDKKVINDFFSDKERKVIILKISLPATIKQTFNVEILEKDFILANDTIRTEKVITIPKAGFWEFSLEIRPEKDAAIYMNKKFQVE